MDMKHSAVPPQDIKFNFSTKIDEHSAMMILEAHRNLLELNDRNKTVFKSVVAALEANLDE